MQQGCFSRSNLGVGSASCDPTRLGERPGAISVQSPRPANSLLFPFTYADGALAVGCADQRFLWVVMGSFACPEGQRSRFLCRRGWLGVAQPVLLGEEGCFDPIA